jgi:Transglycosylase-like domain
VRKKLFVSMSIAALTAVPAALAATTGEVEPAAKLPKFQAFERAELRAFKKAEKREAALARKREARKLQRLYGSVEKPAALESIAACESGGDPAAVSADGTYRGKYQFSYATWASVGGSGDPAAAPEAEQDYRAALLYNRSGPGQWPVCGA